MIFLGFTGAISALLIGGFGVVMLVLRPPVRIHAIECLCLSWLFGSGLVSLGLWIGGAWLRGTALTIVVALMCLALGLAGWQRSRNNHVVFQFGKPDGIGSWLLIVVLAAELALAFFISWKNPLGWDGSFNWENKARFAFLSNGSLPAAYYSSASQSLGHPEYPLMVPYTELWLYLCIGEPNQFVAKLIFPVFYGAGVGLLTMMGARLSGRAWIGLTGAALLFFIPSFVRNSGGVASGYVDVPLSVIYLVAIGYLLLFQSQSDPNALRITAVALTLLPWTKMEGAILWLVGALITVAICWRKKRALGISGVLAGAVMIVTWQLFLRTAGARPPHDFMAINPASLWLNFNRVPEIARLALMEFVRITNWSLFWLLVMVAFGSQLYQARNSRLLVIGLAIIGPIAAYASTYLFSAWPDFKTHLDYSFGRLLLHVTPLGCLLIALTLRSGAQTSHAENHLTLKVES